MYSTKNADFIPIKPYCLVLLTSIPLILSEQVDFKFGFRLGETSNTLVGPVYSAETVFYTCSVSYREELRSIA